MKIFRIVFHHEKIVSLHATKTVKNEWATACDEFPHLRRAEIILKNNLGARGASKNVKIPSEAFNLFFFLKSWLVRLSHTPMHQSSRYTIHLIKPFVISVNVPIFVCLKELIFKPSMAFFLFQSCV